MMAVQTEAECLLTQGALYKTRILLRQGGDAPVFAGFKAGAFSLYYGDEPIFHFDLEGRWQRAYVQGRHFLKSLDTSVRSIDRNREGSSLVLRRQTLGYAEASDLDIRIRQAAIEMIDRLGDEGSLRAEFPTQDELHLDQQTLRDFLERVLNWDAAAWFAQRERYVAAYSGPFFQPPDGVNRIVFQTSVGTQGPSTFDRQSSVPHHVRSPEEFEKHVGAVVKLWGKRVSQARAAYLGGSDALHQDPQVVLAHIAAIEHALGQGESSAGSEVGESSRGSARLEGTHAFLEDFRGEGPSSESWSAYRKHGLTRVHLGIESGDPGIRQSFGKAWTNSDLARWAHEIKSAIGSLSVLVLDTPCHPDQLSTHQESSLELLAALPLGPGDVVAILDGSELLARGEDHPPYDQAERLQAQVAFKNMLRPIQVERKAKVAVYSLDKLWM